MHAEFERLKNDHKQLIDIHNDWKSRNDAISATQIEVCMYVTTLYFATKRSSSQPVVP